MITPFQWCARIAGLLALVAGLMLGRVAMPVLLNLHLTLGGLTVVCLLTVALLCIGKIPVGKLIAGILWALFTITIGLRQATMITGEYHWTIELLHVLLGIGAIGMTEMLAAARARATQ